MTSMLILVPVSCLLLGIAIAAFLWAVDRRQFDDLDTPALRVLLDDDAAPPDRPPAPVAGEQGDAARR
jgi:cbb3-type cytochrome oxidase maturation protein